MAYTDDQILAKLKTRRDAIIDELTSLSASTKGGGINIVGAGTVVDHAEYAERLERQLEFIKKQIAQYDGGPADEIIEVST